jgi:hypothetical protein
MLQLAKAAAVLATQGVAVTVKAVSVAYKKVIEGAVCEWPAMRAVAHRRPQTTWPSWSDRTQS